MDSYMGSGRNMSKFGWVSKASNKLNISHTQVKRFIDKYYKGEYFRRIITFR